MAQSVEELSRLSIDELANVEVTSASKRAEPLSAVPAAIYVIGHEDIQRSPATSLPELLRLAPNLHVQRIDSRQYTVSARGFSGYETSNKLLVLIDGRSVYSTLFSGVFWDLRQPMLDDVDRIEVISGPGGTLYGANAVNGVINVISRSAAETQGGLVRAEAGSHERLAGLRYGGALGGAGSYRIYASGYDRRGFPAGDAGALADGGEGARAGFRADLAVIGGDLTIQGDIFGQDNDNGGSDSGHNILARWTGTLDSGDTIQAQAYYDRYDRHFTDVFDALSTYDLTVQANVDRGAHRIVLGGGMRATHDRFDNDANAFVLDPESRWLWNGNLFVQDSVAVSERVTLTGGVKLERGPFTGIEVLPSARVSWQPADRQMLWAAVSRAIRSPSRIDRNLVFPGVLEGGTFQSEKLTAIEAGYRGQPSDGTSLSVSFFYNLYDDLRTTETTPVTFVPIMLGNGLKGETYGVEAWGSAQLTPWWRLSAGVATLHKKFELKPGHDDLENGISLGNDPDFQVKLHSRMNLTETVELDVLLRGADGLPNPPERGYVDADVRLGWRATPKLELFVSGLNLLHARRDDSADGDRGQLVPRSILAGARVGF